MSLLSKIGLLIFLFSTVTSGLTTDETPLFDPYISGKNIGLGKAAGFSTIDYNNIIQNPASIIDSKGMSLHANQFMNIDYSSIIFSSELGVVSIAVQYLGSTISDINRSVANGNLITEVENYVPYEFHSMSFALAKKAFGINFGAGIQLQTLILDDTNQQTVNEFMGISFQPSNEFRVGLSIQNITPKNDIENALQRKSPIYGAGVSYKLTNFTQVHLAFINNENEVSTHSTVHYGIEQYIGEYLPVRIGIDHNRYTFGAGVNFDPFEIDIGWAQSLVDVLDDQLTVSISYGFEEKNHLYKK